MKRIANERDDEAAKWEGVRTHALNARDFWNRFLQLRMGPANDQLLDAAALDRLLCIIRAVSWVESRHGTGSGEFPARDPMQCGNPNDVWWRELTGQTGSTDRFIGGPGAGNYDADELGDAVATAAGFPGPARLSLLADPKRGHANSEFSPIISYYWAIPYLIHRTNTHSTIGATRKTYKCDDLSIARLKEGAVDYNGGGDPGYGKSIDAAVALIGCGDGLL